MFSGCTVIQNGILKLEFTVYGTKYSVFFLNIWTMNTAETACIMESISSSRVVWQYTTAINVMTQLVTCRLLFRYISA